MLDVSHNPLLVIASLAIALMAGFTGLSLTRGASALPLSRRKFVVAMAAVALGGGIWSMHFVAMLGMQLPIPFYYDALITLISALLAILLTGVALLVLHFGDRTPFRIALAGSIVGVGIAVMHYTGMSGIRLCAPVYSVSGIAMAGLASVALSIGAFRVAYGDARNPRGILLGTVGFGLSVFCVHFIAMAGTGFVAVPDAVLPAGPLISNEVLAFGVTLAAFVISGGFMLTGATFADGPQPAAAPTVATAMPALAGMVDPQAPIADPQPVEQPAAQRQVAEPAVPETPQPPMPEPAGIDPGADGGRIPFEKDGRIQFLDPGDVAALRAEGHYSVIYAGEDRLFCPWSIAQAEDRLAANGFLRTHRSYLVNGSHVSAFERKKDTGVLYFDGVSSLEKVPVARARLSEVRERLGV